MIFWYDSYQRYFLHLLVRDAVWVSCVIAALISLTLIAGNALVLPLSRVVRTRTAVLMGSIVAQAIAIVLCGLLRDFYLVVCLCFVCVIERCVRMDVEGGNTVYQRTTVP